MNKLSFGSFFIEGFLEEIGELRSEEYLCTLLRSKSYNHPISIPHAPKSLQRAKSWTPKNNSKNAFKNIKTYIFNFSLAWVT